MSGKSTQVTLLKEYFENNGKTVWVFHFPTKNEYGRKIYDYYEGKFYREPEELELLHTLDKLTWKKDIETNLELYDYVILDRYRLSQIVYATASDLDEEWLKSLTSLLLEPDVGFLLDIPVDIALNRKINLDAYESDYELLKKARRNFLKFGMDYGYKIIDATHSPEEIHKEITKTLDYLEGR